MYQKSSEEDLLNLLKANDYNAFNEIYHRHASALYGAAYNIIRDKEICMDLLQDIFSWFWEHRDKWQLSSCKGYLLTAVKFKAANYIRNNKFKSSLFQQLDGVHIPENKNEEMEVQELLSFVKNVTAQLPDRCREIFKLSRFDQLSNKEIAARLNLSEKTVENQITIALKKLRGKLANHYTIFLLL